MRNADDYRAMRRAEADAFASAVIDLRREVNDLSSLVTELTFDLDAALEVLASYEDALDALVDEDPSTTQSEAPVPFTLTGDW